MSSQDLNTMYEHWERKEPQLWRDCYPKVYQVTGGNFASPKYVALNLLASILWMREERETIPLASIHMAYAASAMIEHMVPSYFVDRDFFVSISQTVLPRDLRWTDVPLPYDAGIIYLPKGALKDPEGEDISFLAWFRRRAGDTLQIGKHLDVAFDDGCFVVVAVGDPEYQRAYSRAIHDVESPYIDDPDVKIREGLQRMYDLPITKDDDEFLTQATSLCFKILLSVQFRPQVLTPAAVLPDTRTKKGKDSREVWSPNYVGRGHSIRREYQGGTHASPRTYWRPAHWTHQAVGKIKDNPDFISINKLPRTDEGMIDWDNITDDVKEKFWNCHKLTLIEDPVLVMGSK